MTQIGEKMNKNIIIAILVVIIIAAGAVMFFGQSSGKMDTKINFLNINDTIQNGEQVEFQLTDASGNPIAGETVKLTYNGNETYTIVTDSAGKGALFINGEEAGEYELIAQYDGNDKYNGCNAQVKLNITGDAPDNEASDASGSSVANTAPNKTNPTSNRYYLPQYGIWVENGVVVSGQGAGLSLDDWLDEYTSRNPHYNHPEDPLDPRYDPDHPYPGDINNTD